MKSKPHVATITFPHLRKGDTRRLGEAKENLVTLLAGLQSSGAAKKDLRAITSQIETLTYLCAVFTDSKAP